MMVGRIIGFLLTCHHGCRQLCGCIQVSPLVFCLTTAAVLVVVSLILVFNVCLARLFTVPGAFVLNVGFFWVLLRWVVRVLVFPGSIVLWKRNTEATYRVEMAKQWTHQLGQLHAFLQMAASPTPFPNTGATLEGAQAGCLVVEGLARNLRVQQRDQVKFTQEQAHMRLLVTGVEKWLTEAKVYDRRGGKVDTTIPLTEWMLRMSQSLVPVPLNYAVASTPLVKESEADAALCIERLEQLVLLLDGLHRQQDGFCASARRFLRAPTVGSLHQLRAELLVRYSGHHYWVRTPNGRKIDSMYISCRGSEGSAEPEDAPRDELSTGSAAKEDVPLKEVVLEVPAGKKGPVIVWCNPNAAYYETMAYESHWLDFYLSHGCSVFLFNYSGFGRSQGHPTPATVADDGNAVIEFLKRRGFTEIGVHGRSIGGIAACSLAQVHHDVVKILVADRTFSTLAKVAKYTFGNWAVKGLSLSATWVDNSEKYMQARCYKVMMCDPKDTTIPDLASLRSSVAMAALTQVPQGERLTLEDDKLQRLAEAWAFFETLIAVCDRDDLASDGHQCASCRAPVMPEVKRPARQPVVGKPQVEPEARPDVGEEDTQRLVSSRPRPEVHLAEARKCVVNIQWLEEHVEIVQTVMASHFDSIRLALDVVGTQFNASGMTLDDALRRPDLDEACEAIRCFLANIQVWGSLGSLREPLCPSADRDIELFLQKGLEHHDIPELASHLSRVATTLNPDKLASYHRHLSRSLVAQVRRDFRQQLSSVRRAMESVARDDGSPSSALCACVLSHLHEIEGFMTTIYRFFKCVDIVGSAAGASLLHSDLLSGMGADAAGCDDFEEGRDHASTRPLLPTIDRSISGYVMCIDCGHNGILSEAEMQHLALHLRASKFGKYRESGTKESTGIM